MTPGDPGHPGDSRDTAATTSRTRAGYGRTVVLGLATGALAAVGSARTWATAAGDAAGVEVTATATGSDAAPLALALSLVALAAWGVLLVLRGRVRVAAAVAGLLASAGVLAAVATGFSSAPAAAARALQAQGGTGDVVLSSLTGWYWVSAASAVLSVLSFAVAVRRARTWPEMGTRYDAPAARSAPATQPADERDLWRALDDGHDPTA